MGSSAIRTCSVCLLHRTANRPRGGGRVLFCPVPPAAAGSLAHGMCLLGSGSSRFPLGAGAAHLKAEVQPSLSGAPSQMGEVSSPPLPRSSLPLTHRHTRAHTPLLEGRTGAHAAAPARGGAGVVWREHHGGHHEAAMLPLSKAVWKEVKEGPAMLWGRGTSLPEPAVAGSKVWHLVSIQTRLMKEANQSPGAIN